MKLCSCEGILTHALDCRPTSEIEVGAFFQTLMAIKRSAREKGERPKEWLVSHGLFDEIRMDPLTMRNYIGPDGVIKIYGVIIRPTDG